MIQPAVTTGAVFDSTLETLKKAPIPHIATSGAFRESEKLELGARKASSFSALGHPRLCTTLCRLARGRL